MKRILCVSPDRQDATSFWRAYGPLRELWRVTDPNEFTFHEEPSVYNWSTLLGYDCLFLQRPQNSAHKALINLAKDMGIKVWIDHDDDLFNIPNSNPASLKLNDREVQRDIMSMIVNADLVTVTTEDLVTKLKPLNDHILQIPNAWNHRLFNYRNPSGHQKSKTILWRGSRTHAEDMDTYLPEISRVAKDHPDWKFVFVGGAYWKVHNMIPKGQIACFEFLEPMKYYRLIHDLSAKIAIVPLHDHTFNHAKSNIAWQEATFAGAAVLCPNWTEWQNDGAILYASPYEFEKNLRLMMEPNADLKHFNKASWKELEDNFNLQKANEKRLEALRTLLG